jgi:hypothetical protein
MPPHPTHIERFLNPLFKDCSEIWTNPCIVAFLKGGNNIDNPISAIQITDLLSQVKFMSLLLF